MAVKELIEQDKYTIWPQRDKITGIESIVVWYNPAENCVDFTMHYNDTIKNRQPDIQSINAEELNHLQSHVNRLQLQAMANSNQHT